MRRPSAARLAAIRSLPASVGAKGALPASCGPITAACDKACSTGASASNCALALRLRADPSGPTFRSWPLAVAFKPGERSVLLRSAVIRSCPESLESSSCSRADSSSMRSRSPTMPRSPRARKAVAPSLSAVSTCEMRSFGPTCASSCPDSACPRSRLSVRRSCTSASGSGCTRPRTCQVPVNEPAGRSASLDGSRRSTLPDRFTRCGGWMPRVPANVAAPS